MPEEELVYLFKIVKRVVLAVKDSMEAEGIRVVQNNGSAAGQVIFHFHVHVVTRFEGQKLPSFHDLKIVERSMLEEMAAKIRQIQ
jgi:histidine triad (HIT) family protein